MYIWWSRTEPPNFKSANILAIAILGSTTKFTIWYYYTAREAPPINDNVYWGVASFNYYNSLPIQIRHRGIPLGSPSLTPIYLQISLTLVVSLTSCVSSFSEDGSGLGGRGYWGRQGASRCSVPAAGRRCSLAYLHLNTAARGELITPFNNVHNWIKVYEKV